MAKKGKHVLLRACDVGGWEQAVRKRGALSDYLGEHIWLSLHLVLHGKH